MNDSGWMGSASISTIRTPIAAKRPGEGADGFRKAGLQGREPFLPNAARGSFFTFSRPGGDGSHGEQRLLARSTRPEAKVGTGQGSTTYRVDNEQSELGVKHDTTNPRKCLVGVPSALAVTISLTPERPDPYRLTEQQVGRFGGTSPRRGCYPITPRPQRE